MTVFDALYKLILGPLGLLFDAVYTFALRIVKSPGMSIVFLSLAINLLVLPMYNRADALQLEEGEEAARLKPGVSHIRKVFRGDERFMMLQTYYRQNHYKPYYALKGSLSLLLQIPFFIAAYNYLSGLQAIQGVAFGPIRDLGAPDGLIRIGGVAVHLLPILMTGINLVSGAIYTKGMPLKSKIQLYGMALIFLVLLYPSPSGLVFYWTLNNVFSLAKNVYRRVKPSAAVRRGLCSALGAAFLVVFLFVNPAHTAPGKIAVFVVFLAFQLPALLPWLRRRRPAGAPSGRERPDKWIFYICCALLALLTGVLIPSELIKASPEEFVILTRYEPPVHYLYTTALLGLGTFVLWGVVFYRMSSPKGRSAFSAVVVMLTGAAVVDYMFFGKGYGNISSWMVYDEPIDVTMAQCAVNAAVVLAVMALLYLLWRKLPVLARVACLSGCLAVAAMSVMNIASIQEQTPPIQKHAEKLKIQQQPAIQLDRKGRNVIVLMLDRAVDGFVPYMLNEIPGLMERFDGFTWYPNTISYGYHTNVGSISLFGGYEYTPDAVSARTDVKLREKHNEALRLMPLNFRDAGYQVTVCDLPYANYKWISDLSIFDDCPDIRAFNASGRIASDSVRQSAYSNHVRNRNLFCYSIMRVSPLLLHMQLYNEGFYNEADALKNSRDADGVGWVSGEFLNAYLVLKNLKEITYFTDDGTDTFLSMCNDTPHGVVTLQEPEYEPAAVIDNEAYEEAHELRYTPDGRPLRLVVDGDRANLRIYQVNMAAFLKLGDWFDYMRENGVYDNTRIILVADHGYDLYLFGFDLRKKYPGKLENMAEATEWWDTMSANPLLMVKDFDAKGFTTDTRFMTNADTPCLAFSGLIDDPRNPATGNPVTDDAKYLPEQHIIESEWRTGKNKGYAFADPVTVTLRNQNIFESANWTVEGIGE